MTDLVRRIPWPGRDGAERSLATREWLVTNGLGGYASGTVTTLMTRRYHGLLIAALPAPLGRMNMLSHLHERLDLPDGTVAATTTGWDTIGAGGKPAELLDLVEFRLEMGLPVWRYELGSVVLEKRLVVPYRQNTVHVTYRLVSAPGPVGLRLRPAVHFRPHERPVSDPLAGLYGLTVLGDRYEIFASPELPRLRLRVHDHQLPIWHQHRAGNEHRRRAGRVRVPHLGRQAHVCQHCASRHVDPPGDGAGQ